jgi:hypothetical protein
MASPARNRVVTFHRVVTFPSANPSTLTVEQFSELFSLAADLEALTAAGSIEEFIDEHGVTRYRPIAKAEVA